MCHKHGHIRDVINILHSSYFIRGYRQPASIPLIRRWSSLDFSNDPLSFQSFRVYDRCSYERDNKSLIEKLVVQAKNTTTVRECVCRGGVVLSGRVNMSNWKSIRSRFRPLCAEPARDFTCFSPTCSLGRI